MPPAMLPLALCTLSAIAGPLAASFQLWVEPAVPVVERGGSIELRLRTSCQDPSGAGTVETTLELQRLQLAPGEELLRLLQVPRDTEVQVDYTCGTDVETLPVRITTYSAPEPPQLRPVPALAVGEQQEVLCRVAGAVPIRCLALVLSCGSQVLHTQSFASSQGEPEEVELRYQLTAQRWHRGHNLSCQAQLDLAPHGPRLSATSEPQLMDVYEFPEDPKLSPDLQLEVNEVANVSCEVGTAFPVPTFQLALANRSLPLSVSPDGHSATAQVSHERAGHYQLLCRATAGPKQRQAQGSVRVYSFPPPRLDLNTSSPAAGTVVAGSCSLPANYSSKVRVQAGHRVLVEWAPHPLLFSLLAREEEDGMELSCEAEVPIEGKAAKRSRPIRLRVIGHDPEVLLPALLAAAAVLAAAAAAGVSYGAYYRQKKIRQYRLEERQRRLRPRAPAAAGAGAAP